MPRKKYLPKNRYCHNSNLSEHEFSMVLWCWVQGASAPETVQFVADDQQGGFQISTKTISRYFKMFGDFLFSRTIEGAWLIIFLPLAELKADMPQDVYEDTMDSMANIVIDALEKSVTYEAFRTLVEDIPFAILSSEEAVELRKIRSARKGLKSTARGDLALAEFRAYVFRIAEAGMTEKEKLMKVYLSILEWMTETPL
ncbi:MAG: hypothetical protein V3V13_01880 [Paracoccaceae bacterium]